MQSITPYEFGLTQTGLIVIEHALCRPKTFAAAHYVVNEEAFKA
jgi:hypothetical protein